jgi:hypothetical protein
MAFQLNNPYAAQENVADQFMKGQQIYSNNQKASVDSQSIDANNQKLKAEEIKRLVSIVTPENYQSIRVEGIQKGLWGEQDAPTDYESAAPVIQQIRQQFGSSASATTPAAIQVAEYYRRQDKAGRKNFNEANRSASSQYLNTGAGFTNPYSANEFIPITPKAESMPGFKADVVEAETTAKNEADFKSPEATKTRDKALEAKQTALDVTNRLLENVSGVKANRGGVSRLAIFPNVSDSAVNAEADLETLASLLTTENLGLLKGVLSDTDMKVLKDIGAGGLKGADAQVLANLATIKKKLEGTLNLNTPINTQETAPIDFGGQTEEDFGSLTDANMEAPIDVKRARLEELRRKAGR